MLTVISAVAIVLSVWRYYEKQYQAEQTAKAVLEKAGWFVMCSGEPDVLPLALQRLCHDFNIPVPICFYRTYTVSWDTIEDDNIEISSKLNESRWQNVNNMLRDAAPQFRLRPEASLPVAGD